MHVLTPPPLTDHVHRQTDAICISTPAPVGRLPSPAVAGWWGALFGFAQLIVAATHEGPHYITLRTPDRFLSLPVGKSFVRWSEAERKAAAAYVRALGVRHKAYAAVHTFPAYLSPPVIDTVRALGADVPALAPGASLEVLMSVLEVEGELPLVVACALDSAAGRCGPRLFGPLAFGEIGGDISVFGNLLGAN